MDPGLAAKRKETSTVAATVKGAAPFTFAC
jgi:hypothetical protein